MKRFVIPKPAELEPPKRRTRGPKRNKTAFYDSVENIRDRFVNNAKDGDWSNLKPSTLVGLYAYLHELVYGVLPEELADDWYPANSTAKRFLEAYGKESVEFMRWAWKREKMKRAKNPDTDFRITWRYQFSQKLMTDYRVARNQG